MRTVSLKKNFLYNATYQMLLIIVPLITTPYISRVLGAEQIGIYSYTNAISKYFVLFAMLGMANYGNRSCAMVRNDREKLSRTFWEIYGLQFFTAVFCIVGYVLFVAIGIQSNKLIYWIWLLYVVSALLDISWLYFGLEEFKFTTRRNIIIKIISVICIFLFVKKNSDLWYYTLIVAGSFFLNQLVLWPCLRKHVDWYKPSWEGIVKHIKPNLILFIPVIAVSLYKYMDKIMLGILSDMMQSGYYEQTEKIINIPLGLINALGTVMLPRMSNYAAAGLKKKSMDLIGKSMMFVCFLSSALTFGISGVSTVFTPFFFGESYLPCAELISAIAPTCLFIAWANVIRTQYLIPQKKDVSYIISVLLGAIVNAIINGILIGRMGAMGAVIGTIFAEAMVCIAQTIMVMKKLPILVYFKNGVPFVFIGMIMEFIVRGLGTLQLDSISLLAVQIIVGGCVYIILSYIYIALFHKEIISELKRRTK